MRVFFPPFHFIPFLWTYCTSIWIWKIMLSSLWITPWFVIQFADIYTYKKSQNLSPFLYHFACLTFWQPTWLAYACDAPLLSPTTSFRLISVAAFALSLFPNRSLATPLHERSHCPPPFFVSHCIPSSYIVSPPPPFRLKPINHGRRDTCRPANFGCCYVQCSTIKHPTLFPTSRVPVFFLYQIFLPSTLMPHYSKSPPFPCLSPNSF